ncbi:MAG: phosphoserine transaminase [Acidimicrobiales bacterium]|nr:phosphoserine transaminase [Acidimicrobiales bacterium]
MATTTPDISIPDDLKPVDGRFGSGPSKVRPEQLQAVVDAGHPYSSTTVMGTSHRQPPVKFVVASLRNGLAELLQLPDGYEIILGNGGTHACWDGLVSSFIEQRSLHATFGEFSSKFAKGVAAAPFLDDPVLVAAEMGSRPIVEAVDGVDTYALTHNETSTGVMMPVARPAGADGLVAVDATSAAGGLRVDLAECDVYYFSPQKGLAADGGLWLAAVSPAAIERIEARAAASDRWVPPFVDLQAALDNARKDQTLNTPALATLLMADNQVQWLCHQGGLEFAAGRSDRSAEHLYGWADAHELATPFVTDPDLRSKVVGTIDFDESVDAATVAAVLRKNGILDTEPYRKLGRNQLRVAMFPAIDPDDITALTACIDHVLEAL